MKKKKDNNRGELMLEALIVYPITLCLLFFVLSIFSILFQRWNIQTIANDSAARMAQTYRLSAADESTGYVSAKNLTNVATYRYVFNKKQLKESVENRVSAYAGWRLTNTTYTKNVVDPVCDVEVVHDTLGRRHIEVKITGEYAVPFGEIMTIFGFPGTTTYEVAAYAECVDLLDYIHTIDFVKNKVNVSSSLFSLIDSILALGKTIETNILTSSDPAPGSDGGGFR